jgi:hypothetical protein
MKRIIIVIATLASMLPLDRALAQEHPADRGMFFTLRVSGGAFTATEQVTGGELSDAGGGLGLAAGYYFNPAFGLLLELTGTGFSAVSPGVEAGTGSMALLMQYRFLSGHLARPYLRAGLAGYSIEFTSDLGSASGNGGSVPLGAGCEFIVGRHVSLGIDVTHYIVAYDEVRVDVPGGSLTLDADADGSQTNLSMVVLFHL